MNAEMNKFDFQGLTLAIDVGALIKQADAVLKGDLSALAVKGTGKTAFTDISGSAQISNGWVNNNDLSIKTPIVNIQGSGNANLVSEKIDYVLNLQRVTSSTATLIPVTVKGSFSKPDVSLDVKSMVMESQKAKIDEKKQQLQEKLNKKIDQKLKGKVGELLKGLF